MSTLGCGCRISDVSTRLELESSNQKEERNWLPTAVAVAVVLAVALVVILSLKHGNTRGQDVIAPITAPLDPYAASLSLSGLTMSESANLAGGKVTYVDGRIANRGTRTVTAITVQVIFRDFAHEVAQNESQPLKLIRVHEPYVDVEAVSAAPLKPGDEKEFRLIFDAVKPDWDGAYPEIRILHVETK
jgi:hypothetical protein